MKPVPDLISGKIVMHKHKESIKESQVFEVTEGDIEFLVTNFTLTDNYQLIDDDMYQKKNTNRDGQTVYYEVTGENREITILNL